jgi:hypothetical protein
VIGNMHLALPDPQVSPGVPLVHLNWIGKYIAEKRPNVIVHLADHWDFPSLSSYDEGTLSAEGRRLGADIAAGELAFDILTIPYRHIPGYSPRSHFTMGNHENRLIRHVEQNPVLADVYGTQTFADITERYGFKFHDFLEPIVVDGIQYCHYFCRGPNGKVTQSKNGAPSAKEQVKREAISSTAGHQQGFDYAVHQVTHKRMHGLIAGSCYLHDYGYLTKQGKSYWRGIVRKNSVVDGDYDITAISLRYLCQRYTGVTLEEFLRDATDLELMRASV